MALRLVETWKRWSGRNVEIAALPLILLIVITIMTAATSGRFFTPSNFNALASQLPELGLLSLAMMIVMLTSGINLSIISTANLVGVVMALMLTRLFPVGGSGSSTFLFVTITIAAGLLLSLLLGFANGFLVAYAGIPSVLATLGTMILYEGFTLAITKGYVISGLPEMFVSISNSKIVGIPYALLIFVIAAILMSLVLRRRPFGRKLYIVGSNETAASFSAVNTRRILLITYMLSSLLCGIAAIIMLSRFNSANARQGSSILLLTVLIAVLGGTDPNGGFGNVLGLVLSMLILQCITSGLNLIGISSFITLALWGFMLILAIAYRHFRTRRQSAR